MTRRLNKCSACTDHTPSMGAGLYDASLAFHRAVHSLVFAVADTPLRRPASPVVAPSATDEARP